MGWCIVLYYFFFQAEDGIRDLVRSRGLGDVYKRQVQGDTAARLFCLDLQAELVSIAGVYKTSEDLKDIVSKKPVQVFLQEQALIIAQLD